MKNLSLLVILLITFVSCTKQSTTQTQSSNSMATSNGTSVYFFTIDTAHSHTQTIGFGVMQEPTIEVVTSDASLCTINKVGDSVYVTFPTYPIPAGESIRTTMLVHNYDSNGIQIETKSFGAVNVLPSDTIN